MICNDDVNHTSRSDASRAQRTHWLRRMLTTYYRRISDIIHEGTTLGGRAAFPAVRHSTRIERIDNYLVSKLFICRNKT